jgi:hypothetical protein
MSAIAEDSHTTAEVLVIMAQNMEYGLMDLGRIQKKTLSSKTSNCTTYNYTIKGNKCQEMN